MLALLQQRRLLPVTVLLGLAALALAADEKYSDKYDYIEAKGILANDRLREQYYDCFVDAEPCLTPDAKFFKEHIAEAFVTKCSKCTEKQKDNFNVLAEWYTKNQPEKWTAFIKKAVERRSQG